MFWAKPIGDKETFKLMMFCLGNGCSPHLISQWIILSQAKVGYQRRQKNGHDNWILFLTMLTLNATLWFYFDLDHNKWLHLNGLPKEKSGSKKKSSTERTSKNISLHAIGSNYFEGKCYVSINLQNYMLLLNNRKVKKIYCYRIKLQD